MMVRRRKKKFLRREREGNKLQETSQVSTIFGGKNEFFLHSVCEHDKESANHFVLLDSEGMRSKARVSFGGVVVVVVMLFKDTSEFILLIDVWHLDILTWQLTSLFKENTKSFQLFTIWYYESFVDIQRKSRVWSSLSQQLMRVGHTYLTEWNIIFKSRTQCMPFF